MRRIGVSGWIAISLMTAYGLLWGGSLFIALRGQPSELAGPEGHGQLEAAFFTLMGISQPLGLLAGVLLSPLAPSGRTGTVLVWMLAGLFGAVQWIVVAAVVRAAWRQFRPSVVPSIAPRRTD